MASRKKSRKGKQPETQPPVEANGAPDQENIVEVVDERALRRTVLVTAFAGTLAFLAVVMVFLRFGDSFLERRQDAVGEILMREGERLEAAGLESAALERYDRALQARFAGKFNKTHTLKRAGILLSRTDDSARALQYLEQAVSGAHGDIGAYDALIGVLLREGHTEDAARHHQAWEQALTKRDRREEKVRALYRAGEIAEAQGDLNRAMQVYAQADAQYGDPFSAARLAELYAEQGENETALRYLERYFAGGAPGRRSEAMRRLREQILP